MAARRQARVWDWLYAAQSWLAMEDASGLNRKALVVAPPFGLRCRRPKSQLRWSTAARWINETAAAESRVPRFLGGLLSSRARFHFTNRTQYSLRIKRWQRLVSEW